MKAILYDKNIPGGLELREAEKPVPGKGEVLVRVHAVSVNAADYRSMKMGILPKRHIYGAEIAGTVVETGEGVSRLAVGDAVLGDNAQHGFGGFAEYTTAPEALLAKKPENVPFEAAATVSLAGVTALQGLRLYGKDLTGKRVLVLGAGGGVGTYAVQLAKYFGAKVTGVCGTRNVGQTRLLGADRVIDYSQEDCLAARDVYDLILAVNGGRKLAEYRRALAAGGTAVIVGGALKQVFGAIAFGFLHAAGGRKICTLSAKANAPDSAYLIGLIADGKITPAIEKVVPLEDGVEAIHYVARGHAQGKVVIRID
jgi:NADPH:quinone reductase-like Zn-dependent oxidoreductase